MTIDLNDLENRLWATADQLWANTGLKPSEFFNPVLGLIFLRYTEKRFHEAEAKLVASGLPPEEIMKFDYQAEGALYLPENARFTYLLDLAEGQDIGKAINDTMVTVLKTSALIAAPNAVSSVRTVGLNRLFGFRRHGFIRRNRCSFRLTGYWFSEFSGAPLL